jgi:hypothetical protein
MPGRAHRYSAFEPGGGLQRDAAHGAFVKMCLNLHHQGFRPVPIDDQRLIKPRNQPP